MFQAGCVGGKIESAQPSARVLPGFCLGVVGMYEEAAAWFERALESEPSDLYSLQPLLAISISNGDYAEARRWASRLSESDSLFVPLWLSELEIDEGNLEAAARLLTQVVRLERG